MPVVTSADGTTIGYEQTGSGPALILVDGAMCYRAAGPLRPLAAALQNNFTVYAYDRRGRGESADTAPYAPAREVEDLQALLAQAGGEAYVYGVSSGAALSLATAAVGPGVTKLALYEPPFLGDFASGPIKEYTERLTELLEAGRDSDAVELFMTFVGVPPQAIAGMRAQPGWATMVAIAPTLAYDDAVLAGGRVPRELVPAISIPILLMAGDASPEPLQQAARVTAEVFRTADFRVLAGQTHDVAPAALAPVLVEFFSA